MSILSAFKTLSLVATGVAFVALVAVEKVQAALITSVSDPALSNANVIDFESVTPGIYTSITLGDVTFSTPSDRVEFISVAYSGNYNTQGQSLQNTYDLRGFDTLTISFSSPTNAFGFNWGASDAPWTLTAFDSAGTALDSQVLPITSASNSGDFFGINAGSSLISYATLATNNFNDYVFIDNFSSAKLACN
jgi:hypothetical protein